MIGLRITGGILAALFLLWAFKNFRKAQIGRPDFILVSFLGIFLLAVSIYPATSNIIADILFVKNVEYKRILAILIASNFFLIFAVVRNRAVLRNLRMSFDLLVRDLGKEQFSLKDLVDAPFTIMIIIPAYNEKENLESLLPLIPKEIGGRVINLLVVDDGSTDGTYEAVTEKGIAVVRNRINRGGGAALRLGFDVARAVGAEIIVTMDADHQHDPAEIEKLIHPLIQEEADIVVGSRVLGKNLSPSRIRYLGVYVFNYLIRFLTGVKITDCSSGFRAFKLKEVSSLILIQDQYHTSELIIEAAKMGLGIREAPITIKQRLLGKSKKGTEWAYAFSFLSVILTTWFRDRKRDNVG